MQHRGLRQRWPPLVRAEPRWRAPHHDSDDEPAFTDFGHLGYGRLDLRVLWQDIYWVDITDTPHFLVDMSADYRANLVGFLRDGAPGWWYHVLTYATLEAACSCAFAPTTPPPGRPSTSSSSSSCSTR